MPDLTGDGINDVDITNAGDSTTIGGVIFTDAVNVGSGTGNYNTFLAISNNSGVEAGFNSDDTPPIDNTNKDIDQAKTHTVLLSSLVQVTINGVQYYQIRLDLNEANSDPNAQISLDQFKIYSSTNGGIESTTTLFTQNLIYDMDATGNVSLLLSDAGSTGSGTDDYSILIPVSEFAGLDPATTYVYLYTQMGAADGADWNAGATFEEFNLENGVTLTGTKFSDLDGDGIKDAGEGGVAGVTIFIDSNQNGSLDVGERTAVTDANGNYSFFGVALNQTLWIDEVIPSGAIQTTGAHETVTIPLNAAPGSTIQVDPIGNHYLTPHVTITKDASFDDGGDCADTVGELINYTVTVANDGELALSNVVVTDSFEGGSDVVISGPDSGDSNNNGLLDVGETWTYTYTHAVTQDDIDSNGGDDDGTLDNTATVNADSANGSVSDDDDASADVCQNPHVTLDKTASVEGDCADTVGELINYSISVTNDGNVTLENVVVTDDFADLGSIAEVDEDSDGFNDGDADTDGKLDVGETWLYTASHAVTQDDIDNNGNYDSDDDQVNDVLRNVATVTADAVTTGEDATASDDATVDVCQNPHVTLDKTASVDGDCADTVGELVNYSISVTNDGNVTLENVVVTDDFADLGTIAGVDEDTDGFNDGDADEDGLLDVGETWLYTASHAVTQDDIDNNGNYDSDDDQVNDVLRNVATVNADAVTTGETVTDDDDATVDVCQNPHVTLDKTASVDGDCADTVGELINYSISVTNDGNVTLENVVVTDDFADLGSIAEVDEDSDGFNDGDADTDGLLDVGETWLYTASHAVTQDDIDNNGNFDSDDDQVNDVLRNVATVNADAVTTGETVTDDDDAAVDVCQNPAIDLEKYVQTDISGAYVDADDPDGPAAGTSTTVDFKVVLTNTGNVTLENITLSDSVVHTVGGVAQAPVDIDYSDPALHAFIDLDGDGTLDSGEEWANFDTNSDGTLDVDENGDPFQLSVGETVTIYYSLTSELGQHENTAVVTADAVTTGEDAGDNDDANYFVLASDDCVGVRTPGFWANSKWMTFWDATGDGWGTAPNEPKQAGTPGFADGELLYKVYLTDSNHDGVINGDPTDGIADDAFSTGLLIGDYNMNGITDVGEDTIFVSLPDAIKLINASSKQLVEGKGTADGIYMLGRDMVATWLNYLANNQGDGDNGNCIGTVDGATTSPREFLDAAIDWMQQFASTSNSDDTASHTDTNTNTSFHDGDHQSVFEFDSRINPSSASWQTAVTVGEDIPVSGAAMHSALDAYNNTGAINGIEYCCDADSEIALSAIAQII